MLADEDLSAYWMAYKEEADQDALEALVIHYEPLARYLAKKALKKAPSHQDPEDILSFAHHGLLDALRRFDLDAGVKFETYATRRIAGNIIDEQRKMDPLARSMRTKVKAVNAATEALWEKLDRDPTVAELAEHTELTEEEVRGARNSMKTMVAELDPTSVDNTYELGDDAVTAVEVSEIRRRVAHRLVDLDDLGLAWMLVHYCDRQEQPKAMRTLKLTPAGCQEARDRVVETLLP